MRRIASFRSPHWRRTVAAETGRSGGWSVCTANSGYYCSLAVSRSLPSLTIVFVARLPFSVSSFHFVPRIFFTQILSRMGCQSLRMQPTCRQLPAGSAPDQVLLSFPQRAPRTVQEVKDSWALAHSQGRSRDLDSFLPVPTNPERFGL